MTQGKYVELSVAQRADVWRRWKAGESLHTIGRAFDRPQLLSLLVEKRFPAIWLPTKGTLRSAGLATTSPSVGGATGQNTKCAAGYCLGKRPATRFLPVDPSRPTRDRVFAVVSTCRLSAE
jgi:hypothetical protein